MAVEHEEISLHAPDGTRLSAQRWKPTGETQADVLVVHGYLEHAGRYRELAHRFADRGIATLALDVRGHGRSEGRRGFIRHWDDYLDDLQTGLVALYDAPRFILGHSNGGVISLDYTTQRDPDVRGVILTNPYVANAVHVPGFKLAVAKLAGDYLPTLSLPSGLGPETVSRDKDIVESYRRDPRVFTKANAGWFREVSRAQERVNALDSFPKPLLYIFSDSDPVAAPAGNRVLAERLACDDKTVWERKDELHEVLNELDREALHGQIADWILERIG